jgi:hypothetical protein
MSRNDALKVRNLALIRISITMLLDLAFHWEVHWGVHWGVHWQSFPEKALDDGTLCYPH